MLMLPAIGSGAPTLDTIHHTDALTLLRALPSGYVDCVVTSPPYYALRDYGVDGQIGLEATPQQYIARMMEVFSEVRRVLKPSGTVWVNLGDSYSSNGTLGRNDAGRNFTGGGGNKLGSGNPGVQGQIVVSPGLPAKSLMMIPARFAIAMQDDGWILRSECIWHKPNPMPESVTDRPTKAYEMVYLFAKEGRYWYDADSVREPVQQTTIARYTRQWNGNTQRGYISGPQNHLDKFMSNPAAKLEAIERGANLRSVWTINTQPFEDAHFAVMPSRLVETCIKAGCPPGGVVLDMFMGSGTVAITARRLGRHFIGCDLNPEYVQMARKRLTQTDPYQHRPLPDGRKQLSMFAGVMA